MIKKSFKIDKNIYKEIHLKESINAYKDIAKISYENWKVTIEAESDIEEIFNELMNYVIYIQNEQI